MANSIKKHGKLLKCGKHVFRVIVFRFLFRKTKKGFCCKCIINLRYYVLASSLNKLLQAAEVRKRWLQKRNVAIGRFCISSLPDA